MELESIFKSAFSINCSAFSFSGTTLKILICKRAIEPFKGEMSLPSRLVGPEENLDECVNEMMVKLFDTESIYTRQLPSFVDPERHPFGRVITIPFIALLPEENAYVMDNNLFESASWLPIDRVPSLAFDHNEIARRAHRELESVLPYSQEISHILPKKFTMSQLHLLHEYLQSETLDKRNFSKKMFSMGLIYDTNETASETQGRPAKLFTLYGENSEPVA